MNEVRRYRNENGSEIITEWLAGLKDIRARARIVARIDRLAVGNFGDCKAVRDGVSELRVDYGVKQHRKLTPNQRPILTPSN